jgi:hypothetical protein
MVYINHIKNKKKSRSFNMDPKHYLCWNAIIAKLRYAHEFGWTFMLQSYNSSALLLIMIFLTSLFLNPRLLFIMSSLAISIWSILVYIAITHGAEYSINAFADGKIYNGVVLLREIFFLFMAALLCAIAYRWVIIINQYVEKTTKQNDEIRKRMLQMQEINNAIKEQSSTLFSEVESQNNLISNLMIRCKVRLLHLKRYQQHWKSSGCS